METTLHLGDSLKYVNELVKNNEFEKFNAIITDPPYNISKENNFNTMGRAGIDFGEWDKGFDLTSWIGPSIKLLKNGGNIVIFNDWKNMGDIAKALEENGCIVKDLIRWTKTNPMPRNRDRRFITDFEFAIWAVKEGSKWTFNRFSETYERPEIVGPLTPSTEKALGSHTTQKPVYVMKWLIERLTNENDLVFDPFMGSGTTGVASLELNRNFVGVELDETYYKIAENRINKLTVL